MNPNAPAASEPSDECFRCGYNLRGILNDKPCPECGLLAERSRRVTDELHDTRPRWLRRLSWGIWMFLLAILIGILWVPFGALLNDAFYPYTFVSKFSPWQYSLYMQGSLIGFDIAAILILWSAFLLTTPERYGPADQSDRRRRRWLRALAAVPLLTVVANHAISEWNTWQIRTGNWPKTVNEMPYTIFLLTVGGAPLPTLLFYHLRSLAKRARSAHLAEHCAIVGIGTGSALLYPGGLHFLFELIQTLRLGTYWVERSQFAPVLVLIVAVAAVLFVLWALYILIRFAIAFRRAAVQLRRKWNDADLARGPVRLPQPQAE